MSWGEEGRTRAVTQVRIYSHTIHNRFTHYGFIRTPFTHYSQLFAHYSHTIRTLFAPVHIGSHRFTPVRADSRMFKPGSHQYQTLFALSALFAGIHTIREVFALFAQYSRGIRRYSRSIRAVFAQYSHTFAHVRTSVAPRSHSIRNYSQPFTPSRIGKHL